MLAQGITNSHIRDQKTFQLLGGAVTRVALLASFYDHRAACAETVPQADSAGTRRRILKKKLSDHESVTVLQRLDIGATLGRLNPSSFFVLARTNGK